MARDLFEDRGPVAAAGPMDGLKLESREEAPNQGVVITDALAAHAETTQCDMC